MIALIGKGSRAGLAAAEGRGCNDPGPGGSPAFATISHFHYTDAGTAATGEVKQPTH